MSESKLTKKGYELESVFIVQAEISTIAHRAECDPMITLCGRRVYPVIVAPMGSVTDENNYKIWLENNFICVVPRTVDFEKRIEISKETFASFSLTEAQSLAGRALVVGPDGVKNKRYVCIDIAHGTMSELYATCDMLKEAFGDKIEIMTGNVANPKAYKYYSQHKIDYMRAGIGGGSRCTTRCNVGVGYPMASLVDELRMEQEDMCEWASEWKTNIIPDGGISNFDDIQKCIALGGFAVMSGKVFAQAKEASEEIVFLHPDNLNMADAIPADEYYDKLEELKEKSEKFGGDERFNTYWDSYRRLSLRKPYRLYYGMSTKMAQKLTGGSGNTTAEGIAKPILVEYPIAKWADNMAAYMRSCMSYTGCRTIEELRENTELIINESSDKSFRK